VLLRVTIFPALFMTTIYIQQFIQLRDAIDVAQPKVPPLRRQLLFAAHGDDIGGLLLLVSLFLPS
jgi:hypothetical protein